MITFTRSSCIANGKMVQAMEFAARARDYINENHGGQVTLHRQIGGDPTRLVWVNRFESLAQYEENLGGMLADPTWMEMMMSASDLFVEGSTQDAILTTV